MRVINPYLIVTAIYATYIMQSIAVIIVMQFSLIFMARFDTNLVGLGFIASGIGLGKVLMMLISGFCSDKYGRKLSILAGISCYILFFMGLIVCTNVVHAFFLAVLAGIGNSFLDTGSMPALMEFFPASASSVSVLIKGFISVGSLILPLLVTVWYQNQFWYGYLLLGFALFLLCNALLLLYADFSAATSINKPCTMTLSPNVSHDHTKTSPRILIEGLCLVIMSFTISATFIIIMQWLPDIAMHAVGMNQIMANQLISDYSTGSIVAVLLTSFMVKKVIKPIYCLILLPFLSVLILGIFLFNLSPLMCSIVAFTMGFTSAGGLLQLSVVVIQQLFPARKGCCVGLMYTLSGLAFFSIPLIIPPLVVFDVRYAILFDFLMALISLLLGCVVVIRCKRIMG